MTRMTTNKYQSSEESQTHASSEERGHPCGWPSERIMAGRRAAIRRSGRLSWHVGTWHVGGLRVVGSWRLSSLIQSLGLLLVPFRAVGMCWRSPGRLVASDDERAELLAMEKRMMMNNESVHHAALPCLSSSGCKVFRISTMTLFPSSYHPALLTAPPISILATLQSRLRLRLVLFSSPTGCTHGHR